MRTILVGAVAALFLLASNAARADVIPPEADSGTDAGVDGSAVGSTDSGVTGTDAALAPDADAEFEDSGSSEDSGAPVIASDSGIVPSHVFVGRTCAVDAVGAGDIASGFGLLAVLVPLALRRRRRDKK